METTHDYKTESRPAATLHTSELLKPEMTFLAENPEAFGLVPDACPLATDSLLLVANGYEAPGDHGAPILKMPPEGAIGLMDSLFAGLIHPGTESLDALKKALSRGFFEGNKVTPENTVPRYCAALAEVTAWQVLRGPGRGASVEQTCLLLEDALNKNLEALKSTIGEELGGEAIDPAFFTVSLGICRFVNDSPGTYSVDIFSAGHYRLYLLDETGMSPIRETTSPVGLPIKPVGERLTIHHPKPFALLLLSEGIFSLNAAENRTVHDTKGMIWRYRMRLEEQFVRLVSDCVHEFEFSERATRFFTGRARGRCSGSGALAVVTGDTTYEVFRTQCRTRLAELEKLIALLPAGYDARGELEQESREKVELDYLRKLLERNAELTDRVSEAIRYLVLDMLRRGKSDTPPPLPEGVPGYNRLEWDSLYKVFRTFDCENDADRSRIEENRHILRETLSEHWITLRPAFAPAAEADSAVQRAYDTCLDMNSRLAGLLALRRNTVARLEEVLADSMDILDCEGNDWICGRAGSESTDAWVRQLEDDLPALLTYLKQDWSRDTQVYRSLLTAYTAERERLFRADTREGGFFAADWATICEGTMTNARREELRAALEGNPDTAPYAELWDTVGRIVSGTAALLDRIRSRGAETRTARELSDRTHLRLDGLRGAAYEDTAWGESVIAVMDTATRNDFRATVRRWQETRELIRRQAEAFAAYSAMYDRYL